MAADSTKLRLIRCKSCNEWSDGNNSLCSNCGYELKESQKKELNKRREVEDIHIPVWKISSNDPLWLTIVKRPVQLIQLMLYGIVAFLIYLSTAFAH